MDPLELAKVFVKTVVRMFYETEHIVVIDALVFHGALSLSDLVIVLDYGKNQKSAQKLCGKLREGGLLSVFARQELRDGAMKAVNREYFYIDYRRAIDATKYKIHVLDERIKDNAKPTQEKKEFICPQCKSQWTAMELLDKIDPEGRASGFLCRTCDHPVDSIHNTESILEPENDDTPAKFNRQFGPLLKLMQQIDEVTIPAIEGQDALDAAVELPRDKDLNPAARHEAVPTTTVRPTAVKGVAAQQEKIEVSIATNSEYTEAARAAEAQRAAKIAQQNLLPEWHTKSTVVDKEYYSSTQASKPTTNGTDTQTLKEGPTEEKKGQDSELDAVFAALEEQRRKEEAAAEDEEEEEDDEDEDEEFEDVPVGIVGTPNGVPDAKRIKLESSAAPSPSAGATPASGAAPSMAGGEESEEDEFVDV
ncbi:uncharacterized protein BDR25DRAFT_299460 [Lindgomyces ingoldianus]|uniref:Uncharacterized protein n=1 Tax=Lindgomyces ingoldianus TaxID=673940 RepID=A0ACB6RE98_9PLEO|nr:uncharacterized protein BDR25DRAFT_299460 [Lindgomyces ingoldianus]KAF2477569.1 hypothetical protein BDR25DRAFT_299460 [Lindgomyces ingoldianus]